MAPASVSENLSLSTAGFLPISGFGSLIVRVVNEINWSASKKSKKKNKTERKEQCLVRDSLCLYLSGYKSPIYVCVYLLCSVEGEAGWLVVVASLW